MHFLQGQAQALPLQAVVPLCRRPINSPSPRHWSSSQNLALDPILLFFPTLHMLFWVAQLACGHWAHTCTPVFLSSTQCLMHGRLMVTKDQLTLSNQERVVCGSQAPWDAVWILIKLPPTLQLSVTWLLLTHMDP